MRIGRPRRYSVGAGCYDVLSGERPVYRAGRLLGIDALALGRGDRVLDIGCGTGLDFGQVHAGIGSGGTIVGVDASAPMLARAQSRIRRNGWTNVELRHGDAGKPRDVLTDAGTFDAALFTYSLTIIGDYRGAFGAALQLLRPGGRLAVVDLALPTGRWRPLTPLARFACFTGGVELQRQPWTLLDDALTDVTHQVIRGGHIHVAAGTRP